MIIRRQSDNHIPTGDHVTRIPLRHAALFGNTTQNHPKWLRAHYPNQKPIQIPCNLNFFSFISVFDRFEIVLRPSALLNTQLLCSFSLNQNHYFFIKLESLFFNFVSFLLLLFSFWRVISSPNGFSHFVLGLTAGLTTWRNRGRVTSERQMHVI